jgi:hypothetical protein
MSKLSNGIKITNIALGLLLSVAWNSASAADHAAAKESSVVSSEAVEALQEQAFIKIAQDVSKDQMSFQAAGLLFPILKSEPGLLEKPEVQKHVGDAIRALKVFSKEDRKAIIDKIIKKKTVDDKLQSISAVDMTKMIEEEGKTLKAEKAKKEEKVKQDAEAQEKKQKADAHKLVGSVRAPSELERELLVKLGINYDPAQEKKTFIDAIKAGGETLERKEAHKIEELKKAQKIVVDELEARNRRELESASQGLNDSKKIVGNLGDFVKELEKQ